MNAFCAISFLDGFVAGALFAVTGIFVWIWCAK